MRANKILRVLLIFMLVTVGVWLLGRPGQLQPEGPERLEALSVLSQSGNGQDAGQDDIVTEQLRRHEPVTPVTVDFSDVVVDTEDADSMHRRWLRGEIDADENDGLVSEAEMARMVAAAQAQPPTEHMQDAEDTLPAQTGPLGSGLRPGVAFDAISFTQSGGYVPPDPELAVGRQHIVAVANVSVAIYDKRGATLFGPTLATNLFSQPICRSRLYDPNVVYDEEADRWIVAFDKGAVTVDGGYCLLASQSGDPTGNWYEYFFPFNDGSAWMDFPHAGAGDTHIYMGANMFDYNGPSYGFVEGRIFAFDKADLYAGAGVAAIERGLGSSASTPQPIHLHGYQNGTWPNHGNSHYFLTDPFNGDTYPLRRWNPVNNSLTLVGTVTLGPSNQVVNVPQNGTRSLRANDWRPLDFEYRNGYGWTTMTVSCNPGSGAVNCIRWAQINLNNGALGPAGTGTYGSNGQYRFFPDLAANYCDDMAIGYTRSSSNSFPSIWVTGRQSSAPGGIVQPELQLKAGEIAYTDFSNAPVLRWGDYTGMTIDPFGKTFWYFGQYSKNTGTSAGRWGTYVGSFQFPGCNPPLPFLQEVSYLPAFGKGG
ncbi:MAG: hypothetical protein ACOC9E_06805 [Chloroflexota bacterium]